MTKIYKLKVKEHEEFGGLGLVVDVGRPYFGPFSGITVAHDIIEHPCTPHPCPITDELMALGGIVAGRIATGWTSKYGRALGTKDLAADVEGLISGCINRGEELSWRKCRAYLKNYWITEDIKEAVAKGVKDAEYECEERINCDIQSAVGWIVKGYQAYRRRFRRLDNYGVSNLLFNRIVTICDNLLKSAEEGHTYSLHLDFKHYDAHIVEDEYM